MKARVFDENLQLTVKEIEPNEAFEKYGEKFIVYKICSSKSKIRYGVFEYKTGLSVIHSHLPLSSIKAAKEAALKVFDYVGEETLKKAIATSIAKYGILNQ